MKTRMKIFGVVFVVLGLVFLVAGGVAYYKVQDGYGALDSFSTAQNVTLAYNEDGELIDRGTTEGALAIRTLLEDDWGYTVVEADLDPDDPLVNTASEYMFQMATIGYHILHGTQTVVLTEDAEYNGETFPAGVYEFDVEGRYWTDFDRSHPLEGPARAQAWSGTAHGLFAELGVGTTTHSTLQVALGLAALYASLGVVTLLLGVALVWAGWGKDGDADEAADTTEAAPEAADTTDAADSSSA